MLVLKPSIDTKGADFPCIQNRSKKEMDYLIKAEDDIFALLDNISLGKDISCILVDEAQFLKAEQVDQLFRIAVEKNIPVICYGLRTDFMMNGFEGSSRLLLLAHTIEELKTICRCGKKAIFTGRKINGKFVLKESK